MDEYTFQIVSFNKTMDIKLICSIITIEKKKVQAMLISHKIHNKKETKIKGGRFRSFKTICKSKFPFTQSHGSSCYNSFE